MAFVGFKCGTGTAGKCTGFPKYRKSPLSYTESPRTYDHLDISSKIISRVMHSHFYFNFQHFIEGTHYKRRENQPSLAPHKSKEAVDCLLCSDPDDDINKYLP